MIIINILIRKVGKIVIRTVYATLMKNLKNSHDGWTNLTVRKPSACPTIGISGVTVMSNFFFIQMA